VREQVQHEQSIYNSIRCKDSGARLPITAFAHAVRSYSAFIDAVLEGLAEHNDIVLVF